jgi:filamentous hemagglutinin
MGATLTLGSSSSESTRTQSSDTSAGSRVQAGGNVTITATGGGRDSNILVRGSDIDAGKNVNLSAGNNITLEAAANTQKQSSTSHSSNASVGVGMSFGDTIGFTLEVAAGSQSGRDNGTDGAWTNTTVHAGEQVNIASGGDTTLRGAAVGGKRIDADVGGNLHIETLQDTSTYHSQNSGAGFSGSFCIYMCYGGSVSVNASNMHGDGDFASATKQSGFFAGDAGFGVKVGGNTNLVGGVISSTDAAVDGGKNSFVTGSLTMTDLVNHDTFRGSGYSVSVSTSGSPGVGIGDNDVNQSSVTRSGISGIAGNANVRTGVDSTNGLHMTDRERAMREIGAQVSITSTASGLLIELGPLAAHAVLNALEGFFTPAFNGPGIQPQIPAQQARDEIARLRNDPSLTEQQLAELQGLENFLNEMEKKFAQRGSAAGDQVVQDRDPNFENMQFVIPIKPGRGGAGAGVGVDPGAAAGVGGLQVDPDTGLLIPPKLSALENMITPKSGSLYALYEVALQIMQATVNTASGSGDGGSSGAGPTGGNGADTYGTPPNGASPPPDGEDKNPTKDRKRNSEGEMLGQNGTKTPSTTLFNRGGIRVDVENANPGQRAGQVHLQIGEDKYYFNVNTRLFENSDPANIRAVPRAINNRMLEDPQIQRAINTGLKYLGENPIKF